MCSEKPDCKVLPPCRGGWEFSEDSTNPVGKREFKEIERRWLSIARVATRKLENLRSDVLTLLVVSGNDSNSAIFCTVFSSASLSYTPQPHL
jgi:hypothetical protein